MASQQNVQQTSSTKENVDVDSGTSVASVVGTANVQKDASFHESSAQEQANANSSLLSETQAKNLSTTVVSAATTFVKENVAEIAGAIWEDFKKMSKIEKFLAILAGALVVGAAGYCTWKLIGANWDSIQQTAQSLGKEMKDRAVEMMEDFDGNVLLEKVGGLFKNGDMNASIDGADVSKLWDVMGDVGCGDVIGIIANRIQAAAIKSK